MPVPVLKIYAKEAGKTEAEAEECWEKAKKQADHVFSKENKTNKKDQYWAFVNSKTKDCLGIKKK